MEIRGIQEGLATAGEAVKEGAFWLGRHIKSGFDKLVPILKNIAASALNFLRTPAGLGTLGFAVGGSLLLLSNAKCFEGESSKITRIALKISAIALFMTAGILVGYAISTGNILLV